MIPFNKPYRTGKELDYIQQSYVAMQLSGDGLFTKKCHSWLENITGTGKALLTHSCTGALEMAAILAEVGPGDEVVMPSFTFVSTANAFVSRGATPVFVDIRPDTLNIDENKIEAAITKRTRAIVPVHYAGVGCDMTSIVEIANKHGLLVIEDAAHGILSTFRGQSLGTFGQLGTLSFHETKNIISGVGGALLVNAPQFLQRAEVVREKGTNRSLFSRGQVDKYTWVDIGSSFQPGEIMAAFLYAQMEEAGQITARRLALWHVYHEALADLEAAGRLRRPIVPPDCVHNAHMYYILLPDLEMRSRFIAFLSDHGINAVFHYVPLHSSPMGLRCVRDKAPLPHTESLANRLVRLPLFVELSQMEQKHVVDTIHAFFLRQSG